MVRSWLEVPVDVSEPMMRWAESVRQIFNRAEPADQTESATFYMVHKWNYYPLHWTFAYSDKPDGYHDDCRFYTWYW